jgi:branched-chain amino acid transport system substrate-binding protein
MKCLKVLALCVAATIGAAHAQETVKIANIVELTGQLATAGTNFKNGLEMAQKEINAAGGILGRKIEATTLDNQSNANVSKGLTQKVIDDGAFAIFGPVGSGSILVSMTESRRAEVPNFTGGEAANVTKQGNPYVFRTSFTQETSMPKVARYIAEDLKAKNIVVIWINNDFGKGGRDAITNALKPYGANVVADVSVDPGQVDFSAAVLKAKSTNADAAFVYLNEEESARALRELRKQGWTKPIVGETTLTGQKVIELAGDAANGAVAHVGLTVDAPNPLIREFAAKFEREYKSKSDHNGIKGYTGMYVLKAAIEKAGKFDRVAVAQALKNASFSAKQHPGILMDVSFDDKGDLDRDSFLVGVKGGKQEVTAVLGPLKK